jgi:hypothetical protein
MRKKLPQDIVDQLTAEEKNQYALYSNAVAGNMRAYNDEPTVSHKKDLDVAATALGETIKELLAKYGGQQSTSSDRFINRKQALNWLNAQGYKISQGKFYQDCAAGFPEIHRDGSVSKYQVMQYGQQLDVSARSIAPDSSREDEARKLKAEAEIAEMKANKMRREEDALWLYADQAWAQMAAIIGTLRDCIRHHFHTAQHEIIHVAGGDINRNHETFEFCDEVVNRAFNDVAGASIDIRFVKDGETA